MSGWDKHGASRAMSIVKNAEEFGTFGPALLGRTASTLGGVPYFFRVVEQRDGSWWCRRGRVDVKWFGNLDEAIEHATDFASELPPSEVVVHRLDGRVEVIATFE